ncbi:MAG: hypothetical protein JWP97_4422 [Labilithrix sp.]|nr:hypothetical protein [Labilithrix sp.]
MTGAGGAPPAAPVDGAQRACVYGASDLRPCEEDCDRRLAFSCALLAARIERGIETTDGGVERDLPRALLLHERACELLDVASCSNAARMVAAGAGAPPSRRRQVELLEKACRLGDALACTVPARAYANGTGVARDPARATALWERACASGAAAACGEVDAGD